MSKSQKTALVVSVMALLAGTASAASPKQLLTALAGTYPDSHLPAGFSSAVVRQGRPSNAAIRHHAVGEVAIEVKGPDPGDFIFYVVFSKPAQARLDLASARLGGRSHLVGKVPGTKLPSKWYTGSNTRTVQGKTVTHGLTGMFVADGTVLVVVVTDSAHKTDSGNVPGALALMSSARRHLQFIKAFLH